MKSPSLNLLSATPLVNTTIISPVEYQQSLNFPLVSPLNYFPHSSQKFTIVALSLYT